MWKLEVLKKHIGDNVLIEKIVHEGFSSRVDAEAKVWDYYDAQTKSKDVIYFFYLISPLGQVFTTDAFGVSYYHMKMLDYLMIV